MEAPLLTLGRLLGATRLMDMTLHDLDDVQRYIKTFLAESPAVAVMTYSVTWLTSQLACGSAPMSYDDLDLIKGQGINAIVNLCGEFCDLHEIEKQSGFEVYYLPIPDESAPDMELMEKALDWLDEALYLQKKVLVHCRHGLGRTGTFVSAYLLRRGFGLRLTEKKLKKARISPGNFSQWRLLRRYGKQKGQLKASEPRLEIRRRST